MRIINNSKDITTLEVDDKVVFGDLEYLVRKGIGYFLHCCTDRNNKIFKVLNINKRGFIKNLGIFRFSEVLFKIFANHDFPKTSAHHPK